jgi:hypothetical protein
MPFNWLSSIGNNITERAKNPFLGTFAFVWLARNWELVFALFNFDKAYTLEGKITFLTERIKHDAFWTELGWNILWTFTILIITYILINLARIISNLFEKRLTPIILKWTDYNSLVPKSEYQGVLLRMNDLQGRLDKEIQEKLRVQNERDKSVEEFNKLTLEMHEINYNAAESRKEKVETLFNSRDQNKTELLDSIIENYGNERLERLLKSILNKRALSDSEDLVLAEDLTFKGILNFKQELSRGITYELTDLGRMLIQKLQ